MASRPTLAADKPVASPSRRKHAAGKWIGSDASWPHPNTRSVTIHWDIAAIVRWSLIGLAAVLVALATLVVALRDSTNYPTTTGVRAIGTLVVGSDVKASERPRK
jgi:hypothetical protein